MESARSNSSQPKHKARILLHRKLLILRKIINSKSVKRSMIIMDAMIYICKLKLQIHAIKQQIQQLTTNIQEVKVEKLQGSKFLVRVTCNNNRKDLLVSIMEEIEKLKINVCEARVTCKYFFAMEAIVEAHQDEFVDVKILTQAIHEAIERNSF